MAHSSEASAVTKPLHLVGDSMQRFVGHFLRRMRRYSDKRTMQAVLRRAGVPNAESIRSYTTIRELEALYLLARDAPDGATVIEIGSHLGASSCYLAAGLRRHGGILYCVDTWKNETMPEGEEDTFAEFTRNTRGIADIILPLRKMSQDLRHDDIRSPVDLAFIDGDHSDDAVARDFSIVATMLRRDGIIAFHDCSARWPGVRRVIGRALESGEWLLGGYVGSLCWIRPVGKPSQ